MKMHIEVDPHDAEDLQSAVDFLTNLASDGEPAEAPKKADAKKADAKKADAKKADAKKAEESDGPTRDDVRAALKSHAALEGKDAAIAILKDAGEASSISELDEDKFAAVIKATEAA